MATAALDADLLIAEAKVRARRRRLLALVAVLVVGAAIATPLVTRSSRNALGVAGAKACGVTAVGSQLLQNGRPVYRDPGSPPGSKGPMASDVQCSGATIWAVWLNGVGMMQQAYVGARSLDRGRTWRVIFTEGMYGPKAPHHLGSELAVWKLHGPRGAYFASTCPACSVGSVQGTVSLWVTKDGGRTFREYKVPALTGFEPTALRVSRGTVTIFAKRFVRGVAPYKTATVRVG